MPAKAAVVVLLLILAMTGLVALWSLGRSSAGIDFYQMWVGPRIAREVQDFYAPATRARMGEEYVRRAKAEEPSSVRRLAVAGYRRNLELLSTPFLYLLYAPLRGTYEDDLVIFQALAILAFAAWAALLTRTFGYGVVAALLFFDVLLLAFEPVRSDARVVNMNHVLLLMIALAAALTAHRRYALAGAVLALATLTKPYVILTLPLTYAFMLVRARWRPLFAHAGGAAAAACAGIAVSSMYFGSAGIWIEWLRAFAAMPSSMIPLEIGNFAMSGLLRRLWNVDLSWALMLLACGAAVLIARRARSDRHADLLALGLGCTIFQFGSPLVWVHHLLLSVPLVAYLLRPLGDDESPAKASYRQCAAAVALAILAVEPWARFVPTMAAVAAITNVGLVLAYGTALYDLKGVSGIARRG